MRIQFASVNTFAANACPITKATDGYKKKRKKSADFAQGSDWELVSSILKRDAKQIHKLCQNRGYSGSELTGIA